MNVQFKKGVLELCILSLLSKKDYYGYELVREISNRIAISEGTVYPLLRKLTKEKYFDTYMQDSKEGPPRKYYCLTAQGQAYFIALHKEWHEFTYAVEEILKEV